MKCSNTLSAHIELGAGGGTRVSLRLRARPQWQQPHHSLSLGRSPWQLWRSAASCMPGPHSHTNPPSVFTHWPSQEELRHSSMSGREKTCLHRPLCTLVGCRGKNRSHGDAVPCPQQGGNHLPTPQPDTPEEERPGTTRKVIGQEGTTREQKPRGQVPSW